MNKEIKDIILAKIIEYDKIIIMRHIRPDGDAVGSTKGLAEILKNTYPEKKILVLNKDRSDYMSFLGDEDNCDSYAAGDYEDALGIVLDTATEERISNKMYKFCRELIKIDHHVDIKPYGDISWVEDGRSSVCEMITDFYLTYKDKLKINKEAARYLYTGLVTDSGRFRYSSSSGETMRCAGALLDVGINTEELYAELYLDEFSFLKYKAYAYGKMRITENGVAYIHVTEAMQKKFKLSAEDASNSVSFLDSIFGCLIWLAFIDNGDGSTRVRLRSRFITINKLAEKYDGGGHEMASGATVHSKKEMTALITDADKLLGEYKKNNKGWL